MAFEPDIPLAPPDAPSGATRRAAMGLGGFVVVVALTFLGLLAITFFIGRVVPIDPVLAVVGDRATPEVYEAARDRDGPRPAAGRRSSSPTSATF